MTILAVAFCVGLILAGLNYLGSLPWRHKRIYPDRVERLLRTLLKRGFHGGLLRLEIFVPRRRRVTKGRVTPFLQFRKYVESPGVCGIQFGFPNAPWSR